MKTYEYKGFTYSGQINKGLIEALDLKEAREKLATQGILAEKVEPVTAGKKRLFLERRHTFDTPARAMFYRELDALLRAGLPLSNALQVMIDSPELGDNRALLAMIRDQVQGGASLAESLVGASSNVSEFEKAVVEVGERSGSLDVVVGRLASFLEEQDLLQEKVKTAMIYPCIVLAMAVTVAVVILGVMLPRVATLLEDINVPLHPLTRWVIQLGDAAYYVGLPALLATVMASLWLRKQAQKDPHIRLRLDRARFRIPVLRDAFTALVSLRFTRTLTLLLHGGVPLVEGLPMAGKATGSAWVASMVDRGSESVKHGGSLADAVRMVPPLSGSLPNWIQAGEASGNLEDLLEGASRRFQQQWDKTIARSLALLEPALIIAVGLFVLLISLAILLPVFTLNQTLM